MLPTAKSLDDNSRAASFPVTRWTLVAHLEGQDTALAEKALADLCQAYWQPIYAFLRRCGHQPHDAEDLTQGYFGRLIEHGVIGRAAQSKGKLRTFLLTDLKYFLANDRRAATCQKRGGSAEVISIQVEEVERALASQLIDTSLTPECAYDRSWVLTLLARVMRELEEEYAESGRQSLFTALKSFIVDGTDAESYHRVREELGMTEGTIRVNVHRLRARYRERLMGTVAETVTGTAEEVQSELRHLLGALK